MIWESYYWKQELLKIASDLIRRGKQKEWPEISYVRVEQKLMLGFYIVRKLVDAKKISSDISRQTIPIRAHKWKRIKSVTLLNWHNINELYDIDKVYNKKLKVSFLYNQFIHSYVFVLCHKENGQGLEGVYITSDKERHNFVYFIEIDTIIKLFKLVGEEYPSHSRRTYNDRRKDYDVVDFPN